MSTHNSPWPMERSRTRDGNALVVAVGMLALVGTMLAISTDGAISVHHEAEQRTLQQSAIAAVEGVIARKEALVAKMVNEGTVRTWTGGVKGALLGQPNYGVDYIGDCAVMWKIEPCRTVAKDADVPPPPPAAPTFPLIPFVVNPSPQDAYTAQAAVGEQNNQYNYMYRVAAEAQVLFQGDDEKDPRAKAQGVRYISITGEPLFRYVIFYAKEGPKGDLELSHGGGVNIKGSVYSNGAIYLGSGTDATSWTALNPGNDPTLIGPDNSGNPVRCIGIDGIFRMSKPLMFAAFNGFIAGGGFSPDYTMGGAFPSDAPIIDWTNFDTATENRTRINPYRVRDSAGLATINNATNPRKINSIPIIGSGGGANDSRDLDRATKWYPDSLSTFNRKALTAVTNAPVKSLPDTIKNRPLEAQQLVYDAANDDPENDIDEHLEAKPLFVQDDGTFTLDIADAAKPTATHGALEKAGQYLMYAMYGQGKTDAYFSRKLPDFTGWDIVSLSGGAVAPSKVAGLIIRERPIPDLRYFGATPPADAYASSWNPTYVPFAYGKHKRPSYWPFTALWVSDQGVNQTYGASTITPADSIVPVDNSGNLWQDPAWSRVNYYVGGMWEIFSASSPGGTWRGDSGPDDNGFFRSNWRFVHFKEPTWTATGVDLTDTTRYFQKDKFISAQFRIRNFWGGDGRADAQGRKLGLMIRPFDIDGTVDPTGTPTWSWGLNGRKPYVAMCYSPERSFFTQRRLESSALGASGSAFTGSGAGGMDWPPAPTATLYEDTSARDPQTSQYPEYSGGGAAGQIGIDPGEGMLNFSCGPYGVTLNGRGVSYASGIIVKLVMSNPAGTGGFLPSDIGRGIGAYDSSFAFVFSANGQTRATGAIQNVFDDDSDGIYESATVLYGFANAIYDSTPWVTATDNSRAGASNMTIWKYGDSSGYPSAQWDAAVAAKGGDEDALVASLEGLGYTVDRNPSPWPPPPLVIPPVPNVTADYYPDFGTFAGDVNNRYFQTWRFDPFDINSYISQGGAWYSAAPTGSVDASYTSGVTAGATSAMTKEYIRKQGTLPVTSYPLTASFRPDFWTYNALTNDYTPPVDPDAAETGVVGPANNLADWGDANIKRWTDATAYAVGNQVWYNNIIYKCATAHTSDPTLLPGTTPNWIACNSLWVRIEKDGLNPASNILVFKYYAGTSANPAPGDFIEMTDGMFHASNGLIPDHPSRANISSWSNNLLIGEATQSGYIYNGMISQISDVSIVQDLPAPNDVINKQDWEASSALGEPNIMSKYLMSQYQVFFGTQEITEDFFAYNEDTLDQRLATEDVFYNPREFWSQSRWWNEGDGGALIEKETGTTAAPGNLLDITWRKLWARTTVLNLNMGEIQNYIRNRTLVQASADGTFGYATATMSNAAGAAPLRDTFNGLIYAARTNRYPWNPYAPDDVKNAFNEELPNDGSDAAHDNYADLTALGTTAFAGTTLAENLTYTVAGGTPVGSLAPLSPPIKSVDFHHGVMLTNASSFFWDNTAGGPNVLGTSKLTFVTPNQLYLAGNFNSTLNSGKITPIAVMADCLTLCSNSFWVGWYNLESIGFDWWGVVNGQAPMAVNGGYGASTTTYNTCIVTNNQPTTRERVREGQGAPFVNTMLFIENWGGKDMNYTGSLVVLDTCRYTRAFLLQDNKWTGRTPFGAGSVDWGGGGRGAQAAYTPPWHRNMTYNDDLMTEAGTPPYTPIATSTSGIGGWVRVTK